MESTASFLLRERVGRRAEPRRATGRAWRVAARAGWAGLTLVLATGAASTIVRAAALESSLDQFVIYRNGTVYANDTFSDGVAPPSGEGTLGATSSTPLNYFTQGGFTETGGKLLMSSETQGLPVVLDLVNANTGTTIFTQSELARVHTARVLSSTAQTATGGLKQESHTFEVLASFDLVEPTTRSNNYGIGLVDNFGGSGPRRDRLRLSVVKSSISERSRISFWRNDDTTTPSQNTTFGSVPLESDHAQVVLRLARASTESDIIRASYAYVDGPMVGLDLADPAALSALSFQEIANTSGLPSTIFNDYVHTRAEFRQLARDEDNRFDFARLTTGSPVSIAQEVTVGPEPSYLTFNYRFETNTGMLSVMLGPTLLGTIPAPGSIGEAFLAASFLVDGDLLGQTLPLTLELDGPTGSRILLDSIGFAGLVNANFATGDLSGWTVNASGAAGAGVLTVVAVPEPGTWALMLSALAVIGVAVRRRGIAVSAGA